MQPNSESSHTRRQLLKSTAGVSVVTLGLHEGTKITTANPEEFYIGSVKFTEIKEEYEVPEQMPRSCGMSTANYCIDSNRGRITLTSEPVEVFDRSKSVVSSRGECQNASSAVPISRSVRHLPTDSNYRFISTTIAVVDQGLPRKPLSVQEMNHGIQAKSENHDILVNVDDEERSIRKIQLNENEGNESTEITQTIQIRHHGEMDVFGHEDYLLFPLDSDDDYAKARIASLKKLVGDDAKIMKDSELLAVPENHEITKNKDRGA